MQPPDHASDPLSRPPGEEETPLDVSTPIDADERSEAVPSQAPEPDIVTIRVKRVHLYALIGLLVGLAAGLPAGWELRGGGGAPSTGSAEEAATTDDRPIRVAIAGRPFVGTEKAPVTIVEFLDYQCPFCGRHARETLPQLRSEYASKVRYVARNFPITNIHPLAQKASEAAECAHDQGKFWEYHDKLFEDQERLDVESLKKHAVALGLDSARFNSCLDEGTKVSIVEKDIRDGRSYGVTGTPTFFINGRKFVGTHPIDFFKAQIASPPKH